MFDGDDKDTKIAVESTADGVRALIAIDSAKAPERFDFHLGGDVAKLELTETGGIVALDGHDETVGYINEPWAVDANGTPVPTHFDVDGTTVTQVVQHRSGDYAYGIIADPWWNPFSWPWGKWVKKSKKRVSSVLKKCGAGALSNTLGVAGSTGSVNVMLKHVAKKRMITVAGGGYGYVGVAAWGCIQRNL